MEELSRWVSKKAEVFYAIFPEIEHAVIKSFSYFFTQKRYKKGEVIYFENESSQDLYLLLSGDVRLTKGSNSPTHNYTPSTGEPLSPLKTGKKPNLSLVSVMRNQFFGEELFLSQEARQFTAVTYRVENVVLVLEEHFYKETQEIYAPLYRILAKRAQERSSWRNQRVSEISLKQKISTARPPLDTIGMESPKAISPIKFISTQNATPSILSSRHSTSKLLNELQTLKAKSPSTFQDLDLKNSARGQIRGITMNSVIDNDEDEIILSSPKNLEAFKAKFSRKIKIQSSMDLDELSPIKTGSQTTKNADTVTRRGFFDFDTKKGVQS